MSIIFVVVTVAIQPWTVNADKSRLPLLDTSLPNRYHHTIQMLQEMVMAGTPPPAMKMPRQYRAEVTGAPTL
jgi:hypothetical protein